MHILIQETPNPNTLKFVIQNFILSKKGIYFFEKKNNLYKIESKLANYIFTNIKNITSILITKDFISITKDYNSRWSILKIKLSTVLNDFFMSGVTVINENSKCNSDFNKSKYIDKKIKDLIDLKIRPSIISDGGDVIFQNYSNGNVSLKFYGACKGCPNMKQTLKNGIENILRYYFPEIKSVSSS